MLTATCSEKILLDSSASRNKSSEASQEKGSKLSVEWKAGVVPSPSVASVNWMVELVGELLVCEASGFVNMSSFPSSIAL